MAYDDPELFLDKKWRTTSKKHQHYTFEETQNPNPPSSSKTTSFRKHSFLKSSSVRIPSSSSSSAAASLRRSSSTTHARSPENSSPSSLSKKGSSFTRKCTSLAREQKARFYIMRRCVSMLVRWSKHRDSDS